MIFKAEKIEQPYSGQYNEKIYDIQCVCNSSQWTWIKFTDEDEEWCGEFRGEYRGVALSNKLEVIVVLTSDYMYMLDIDTGELIGYEDTPGYLDITTSPLGDIFITDGYDIETFTSNKIDAREDMIIPVRPDDLKFIEWKGNILKVSCYEFLSWDEKIELYFDCASLQWINRI